MCFLLCLIRKFLLTSEVHIIKLYLNPASVKFAEAALYRQSVSFGQVIA